MGWVGERILGGAGGGNLDGDTVGEGWRGLACLTSQVEGGGVMDGRD